MIIIITLKLLSQLMNLTLEIKQSEDARKIRGNILMKKGDIIRSERARMGGDWAVCCLLLTRKIRDVVRWNFMSHFHKCL